jgi:NAD(P)-dependent dehydrogenase (short-subunit alcohol dehydrogenase family)
MVLVCGGSTGIGHAIARNFCIAGATKVVILGRRPEVLDEAVGKLASAYPKTAVQGKVCDIFKLADASSLWDEFQDTFDVLVLNAVHYPDLKPILEQGVHRLWQDFEGNVHVPLLFVERFYNQPNHDKTKVRDHCTLSEGAGLVAYMANRLTNV